MRPKLSIFFITASGIFESALSAIALIIIKSKLLAIAISAIPTLSISIANAFVFLNNFIFSSNEAHIFSVDTTSPSNILYDESLK